ncbi:MAG: sigma 54-interacting transcriptional regulator [Candidatus Latescibacterota bacterium]
MRDGLPDLKIECLFEDSSGGLWIGTHDRGVVRYDGDQFQGFTRRDGLPGDGVFGVVEDRRGTIWFATNQGLALYDGQEVHAVQLDEPCSFLWGACMDPAGDLWFGLERRLNAPTAVCRIREGKAEIIPVANQPGVPGESVRKLVIDAQGRLWVGADRLAVLAPDGFQSFSLPSGPASGIQDILCWPDGSLWLTTEDGLLAFEGGAFENLRPEGPARAPVSLTNAGENRCWAATYDGRVLLYDGTRFLFVHHLHATVRSGIHRDTVGRLWIGTYGNGLYCYDATRFRVFGRAQGIPDDSVTSLAEAGSGELWVGTEAGLARFDGHSFQPIAGAEELGADYVTSLLGGRDGRLWIGTRLGRLLSGDGINIGLAAALERVQGYRIGSLAEDLSGKVWFGVPHGEGFGYFAHGEVVYLAPGSRGNWPARVGALLADRKGNLWVGPASPVGGVGLCRYDGTSFSAVPGIPAGSVLALCEGRDGRIWIGTNEGLCCWQQGAEPVAFTHRDGLACEIVTAIVEGEDGVLWVGTEGGGVHRYDGQVFQTLAVADVPDCNVVHAIHQDPQGQTWFATNGGLIRYLPRRLQPSIRIVQVVTDAVHPEPSEVQVQTSVGRVGIHFRGRSPQERASYLVYRYRLRGHEEQWQVTRERQVEYAGLPPGSYAFEVQAVDRDLNYSPAAETRLIVSEDPRVEALTEALSSGTIRGQFLGQSPALLLVKQQIEEVAWTDLTVLILGETGTGKGLAARAIHEASKRREGPFIHVNCGGLQSELVDSDLFGHERGAFTGAHSRRLGKFELADRGTIFLDEIGDLPAGSQTKLLHVLQERSFERLGGTRTLPANVRVIAATNRDLPRAVLQGSFRPDLYYRLNVFPLQIPPLRERREDIPLLAQHFARQFAAHLHHRPPFITEEALTRLGEYDWPGNVRELEHTLQRAVIVTGEGAIRAEHLNLGQQVNSDAASDERGGILPLEEYERRYLRRVLEHTKGVIHGERGAACLLGVKPTTLRSRLQKLGLK